MFRTTSRSERAAEQARAQAAALKDKAVTLSERVSPTAAQAREASLHAAEAAREWAGPHVGAARDWAGPRLERARDRGVEAAAPRVEAAAEQLAQLAPRVDAARDKIVDELLPRLVEAVGAAAAVVATKTDEARDRSQDALSSVGDSAKKSQHRGGKRKAVLVVGVLGAAAGAGYTAWKRGQPTDDPWATATAEGSSRTAPTGNRLGGSDTAGGLGAGSLASQSGDVNTPVSDGEQAVLDGEQAGGLADGTAQQALDGDDDGADLPGVPASGEDRPSSSPGAKPGDGKHSAG